MARECGGQVSGSLKTWTKAKLRKNVSDGSDEDYMVSEDGVGVPRKRKPSCVDYDDFSGGERRKRTKLSHNEKDEEDSDSISSFGGEGKEDSDTGESDDEDEEFTPDEFDNSADDDVDDEELTLTKKALVTNGKKRKRNPKPVKGCSSSKTCRKRRKTGKGRRKKLIVNSDPDNVSSGSPDYNYTISEEAREQIREAGSTNSFPNSSSLKINDVEDTHPQRKEQERKGKEKVVEVGKQLQVCGVCLSEEGKRTVRGVLNCCTHYFCFDCIMEWSKVESRCPLCKQRFATIRRAARLDGRCDPEDSVIPIPECDQVYPSDNELCSECHQGGDDALMLLCDLCDSPTHTFCVGLGREVPEGSWCCDACRPNAAFTSHDLNELDVPESPTPQVTIPSNTGLGAYTLLERRKIQSRIQEFLDDVSRHRSQGSTMSPSSLFHYLIFRDGAVSPQQDVPHVPVASDPNLGRGDVFSNPGLRAYTLFERQELQIRIQKFLEDVRRQRSVVSDGVWSTTSPTSLSTYLIFRDGPIAPQQDVPSVSSLGGAEVSEIGHHQQVAHPSIPNADPDFKTQVQSMVKSHLKSLSGNMDMDLGYNKFKQIARTCTHTVLNAVGFEHRWNEVYPVQTIPLCNHTSASNEYLIKAQCSDCFNWFVKSVVKEIMLARGPVCTD